MRKKLILLLIVLIFIILMLTAWLLYDRLGKDAQPGLMASPEEETPAEEETPPASSAEESAEESEEAAGEETNMAPDFTVTDIDGNEVSLSDFLGKPVIVNFWASWCGPCKSEMPAFEDAYQDYGDEIVFMMVNLTDGYQETVETASSFMEGTDYTFPVYYDTAFDASSTYGVSAVPVTYFIGADGSAIAMGQGALNRETIQSGIDMILPQE